MSSMAGRLYPLNMLWVPCPMCAILNAWPKHCQNSCSCHTVQRFCMSVRGDAVVRPGKRKGKTGLFRPVIWKNLKGFIKDAYLFHKVRMSSSPGDATGRHWRQDRLLCDQSLLTKGPKTSLPVSTITFHYMYMKYLPCLSSGNPACIPAWYSTYWAVLCSCSLNL